MSAAQKCNEIKCHGGKKEFHFADECDPSQMTSSQAHHWNKLLCKVVHLTSSHSQESDLRI